MEELRSKQTFGVYNQDEKAPDLGNKVLYILMRILSDPSCDLAIEPILKNLSVDLLKFIKFHQKNRDDASLKSFNKNLNTLLDEISADDQGYSYYGAVLESLANKLQSSFNKDQENQENIIDVIDTIDLISFAINDILNQYHGNHGRQKLVNQKDDQDMINIISLLLKCIEKYNENQELQQMSLILIDKILKILQ